MGSRIDFTRKNHKTKKEEMVGYMTIKNATSGIALYIYGDIVSSKADKWASDDRCPQEIADFMAQIDSKANLTVYINSCGGDVYAGISICNILKRHTGHKKAVVDGIAASIASVILMACDEIVVAKGAQIMIHKPWTLCWGNSDDFAKVIEELDRCQKMITDFYMAKVRNGVTEDDITEKINAETWLTGEEAAEIFNITAEERASVAACVGVIIENYRNIPEGMNIEPVENAAEREIAEEAEKLLLELDLFGI